jgi:hypothetical protein
VTVATIDEEIRAYERMQATLEKHHLGKYVVVHDGQLIGAFDTLDAAAKEAADRFGSGPYLIRQVGAPTSMPMPSSLAYFSLNAAP